MGDHTTDELRKKISGLRRKAWKPVVTAGDAAVTASKFSGAPWLSPEETWPLCRHCGQPMQLFLQLSLAELPADLAGVFGEGLLQMFYCTNTQPQCEVECLPSEPFAESQLLRLIRPTADTRPVQLPELPGRLWQGGEGYYPARRITGWQEVEDYPHSAECAEHGVTIDDTELDLMNDLGYPVQGDKLAGWPAWIQAWPGYLPYPNCRQCGRRMQFVFQIDSECNLPHMFGDCGRGYLTQCPEHKDQLAFHWDCS